MENGANTPPVTQIETLLELIAALARELHPHRKIQVILDSSLDRDLGFDSLSRVELMVRIERAFNLRLPEETIGSAETPRDLLAALSKAGEGAMPALAERVSAEVAGKGEPAPDSTRTLVEVLEWHARVHPERVHIHLHLEGEQWRDISYGELFSTARRIAAGLQEKDLEPGAAVAIMLPTSAEFFFSFFGVLLAGYVPVPIYPPVRKSQLEDHLRRQTKILANCEAPVLITISEAAQVAHVLKSQVATMMDVVAVQELLSGNEAPVPALAPGHVALMQYTSGSTGNPKGVVLTHSNLLANVRAMGKAAQVTSSDVFVSWLPLYHDMGLIGAWLGSLYHAMAFAVMSPLTFLARPEKWLWAIHRFRGTLSAAPNFAYELCLRKIPDRHLEGLDLSSWRWAFNGAEPVSPDTTERFCERFAQYGFKRGTMAPVYGLAECSVGLAFPPPDRGPVIDIINRDTFASSGRAVPVDSQQPNSLHLVACGQPLPDHEIRVVDETGEEVAERVEGQVEFRGPSATAGYFHNPEETVKLMRGGWLRSGDLGYMAGRDIYLTGRAKDLIIRAGRNLYPYELEEAVGAISGMRSGCVAVFGIKDATSGTERLIVLAETREQDSDRRNALKQEIDAVSVDVIGSPPDEVVLAPPHTILKTSSGKIRRSANRELYEKGLVGRGPRAVWWQMARLTMASALPRFHRISRALGGLLYAGYTWALFSLCILLTWGAVAILPGLRLRRTVAYLFSRFFVFAGGSSYRVTGLEELPKGRPHIIVANHASYLDAILLTAALPPRYAYVAKRELTGYYFSRILLSRLGAAFIERFDFGKGVADAARLSESMKLGNALVFFPEGTFGRMPGLLPFRMGAFSVAVENEVPVVPVAIRGARSVLRGDRWFPRRGEIAVTIGKAINPEGKDWSEAIRLRDVARKFVLEHCGEPDMAVSLKPE